MQSRVDPLEKEIELLIQQDLSPAAQSEAFANFARETLAEVEDQNAQALGRVPPHETFVDGREGADESSVRPDGVIVYQFEMADELIAWIHEQLMIHSPVGSGRDKHPGLYRRSHIFYADGVEADPLKPPAAEEYIFANSQPYARRIDLGSSPQQPDGVYEVVAHLAAQRFGNIAKIVFLFVSISGSRDASSRQPAIRVRLN